MNDEEIGRALGTALAPPEVQAVPDAGARLRARAGRTRRDHSLLGASVVAVLGVLLAVGVVRGVGGGAPTAPAASPAAGGYSLLPTPIEITRLGAVPASPGPCPPGTGPTCGPAALTVDEVAGVGTVTLANGGTVVEIALVTRDAEVLRAVGDSHFGVRVKEADGTSSGYSGPLSGDRLLLGMPTRASADDLVATLGPVPLRAPRTGPGRLDVPLQLWAVASSTSWPCSVERTAADELFFARSGECLTLRGPVMSIGTADLGIRQDSGQWSVAVGVSGPESAALLAFTSKHVHEQIAFMIGGRAVNLLPTLEGPISAGIELPAPDGNGANALVDRLRP
jgi:hypothetical protein